MLVTLTTTRIQILACAPSCRFYLARQQISNTFWLKLGIHLQHLNVQIFVKKFDTSSSFLLQASQVHQQMCLTSKVELSDDLSWTACCLCFSLLQVKADKDGDYLIPLMCTISAKYVF
ncbi:hypothetical protein RHGRI_011911 [Rhododendron griersonianum]|uniref:Uncharacterized protein n=1 Tax=Rhododendron griersonianum TaxID=479676 RepID=A0AAV6KNQ7_9ERIC|nr:hypothetical protein RHGRI_011911 [Rhododendron griersonianum]